MTADGSSRSIPGVTPAPVSYANLLLRSPVNGSPARSSVSPDVPPRPTAVDTSSRGGRVLLQAPSPHHVNPRIGAHKYYGFTPDGQPSASSSSASSSSLSPLHPAVLVPTSSLGSFFPPPAAGLSPKAVLPPVTVLLDSSDAALRPGGGHKPRGLSSAGTNRHRASSRRSTSPNGGGGGGGPVMPPLSPITGSGGGDGLNGFAFPEHGGSDGDGGGAGDVYGDGLASGGASSSSATSLFSDEAALALWSGSYPYMKLSSSSLSLAAGRSLSPPNPTPRSPHALLSPLAFPPRKLPDPPRSVESSLDGSADSEAFGPDAVPDRLTQHLSNVVPLGALFPLDGLRGPPSLRTLSSGDGGRARSPDGHSSVLSGEGGDGPVRRHFKASLLPLARPGVPGSVDDHSGGGSSGGSGSGKHRSLPKTKSAVRLGPKHDL